MWNGLEELGNKPKEFRWVWGSALFYVTTTSCTGSWNGAKRYAPRSVTPSLMLCSSYQRFSQWPDTWMISFFLSLFKKWVYWTSRIKTILWRSVPWYYRDQTWTSRKEGTIFRHDNILEKTTLGQKAQTHAMLCSYLVVVRKTKRCKILQASNAQRHR